MAKYEVETDQGVFEVESDREPTTEEIQQHLAGQSSDGSPKKKRSALNRAMYGIIGGPMGPVLASTESSPGTAVDLVLEAGLPAVGQAITSPAVGTGITSAIGSGLSVVGNVLAQFRRMVEGEQEGFSGGQVAESAALGAIPGAGPAKLAAKSGKPLLAAAGGILKRQAIAGTAGIAGAQVRTGIDEGRLLTGDEAVTSALVPMAFTGALEPIGIIGKRAFRAGEEVGAANQAFREAGVTPTPGMLMPEQFAATERRMARTSPRGETASKVDRAYDEISDGLIQVAPAPQEPAAIFSQVSPLLNQVNQSKEELGKLNLAATEATKAADDAFAALNANRAIMSQVETEKAFKAAETVSADAFRANLSSVVENAQDIATASIVGGRNGIDPATSRSLFVEHVAKPMEAAFDDQAARLYSGVDNLAEVFDSAPIIAKAKEAAKLISGTRELPPKLAASIETVSENLGSGGPVSLQSMRNVRNDLLRRVRLQSYETDAEERMIKGIAGEITAQINSQAKTALGREMGEQLLTANKFYQEKSNLFDQPGVDILFKDNPNDDTVRRVITGIERAGINSDEYKNIRNLIVKVQEFDPGLAASLKGQTNAIIRGSILHDASTVSAQTGELMVDGLELMKRLDKMGRVEGTLETFGLGNRQKVAEMKTLFDKYDAVKMDGDQWDALFKSPAFRTASEGKLATQLKPTMAAAQSENLLMKSAQMRAAGKIERSNQLYNDALRTLDEVNGDLRAAKETYDSLLRDPVALAFDNPNLGTNDFDSFARSLFDPRPGKVTNADVESITTALRNSDNPDHKNLLKRLQERYVADRMATFKGAPASADSIKRADVAGLDSFFNPANPNDAANEIARAKAILDDEQFTQLEKFSKVASQINNYERLGTTPQLGAAYDIPVYGAMLRGINVIGNLFREGKYAVAARQLIDPDGFATRAQRRGTSMAAAQSTPAQTTVLQTSRSLLSPNDEVEETVTTDIPVQ